MPTQTFQISMPPEAKPLGSKQVQAALHRMIMDFEYDVIELVAVPEEILKKAATIPKDTYLTCRPPKDPWPESEKGGDEQ